MGQMTFDTMLHIINKGYTVKFDKSSLLGQVMRIELSKDGKRHDTYVDITTNPFIKVSTDELVARVLRHALFDFEYQQGEEQKC